MAFQLPSEAFNNCDGLLYCLAIWASNVTGGAFWTFMLLGFSIVLMLATIITFGSTRAYGFGSVVGAMGSLYFVTLQLIPWWIASAFILNGAIAIAIMLLSRK